jgi:hypothetical protein
LVHPVVPTSIQLTWLLMDDDWFDQNFVANKIKYKNTSLPRSKSIQTSLRKITRLVKFLLSFELF